MARGRMIDKVIILSKKINAVSEGAENLYYRIYVNTDDYGRYHAGPEIIKGQIYTRRKLSINIIKKRLDELWNIGLIRLYENDSEIYLEIVAFEQHQKFRSDVPKKGEYPEPKKFLQRSGNVTDTSRNETERNGTKRCSKLSKDKLSKDKLRSIIPLYKEIISYLNEKANKNFSHDADKTIEFINGRLDEGHKLENFKHVIDVKVADWKNDEKMNKFLRPSTLFNKTNFENYRNETLPKRRAQVGENIHKPTNKSEVYLMARAIKINKIHKKHKPEIEKARKKKDIDRLDELENLIKEEIAEFSQEYSAKK